ncbi:MAG: hypothetical protein CL877_09775 [Dehalococcoidales bacterium]|nr:hypothetical protein [Dehalococcoidales bacterium]
MNKEQAINSYWTIAVLVSAIVVVAFVSSASGFFDCYWRNADPNIWYSAAALRFLDGIGSGFVEVPGPFLIQLLGWFYTVAAKVGIISEASWYSFAADPDPLLRIGEYIIAGWLLSSLIYVLIVIVIFQFARFLTGSNVLGFVAAVLAMLASSNTYFFAKITPEALSALFGISSLLFMFKALHAVRFRVFAVNCVVSGTLVFCSMLTKLNALPLLAFLPVVSLLKLNTPMDRLPSRSTNIALLHTFAINLLLAPLTIGLMKTWAPMTLKEGTLSKIFYLILVLAVLVVGYVRLWLRADNHSGALLKRALLQGCVCLLLFSIGYQLTAALSLIHPEPNAYIIVISIACLVAGLLTALAVRWAQDDSPAPRSNRFVKISISAAVCFIMLSNVYELLADTSMLRTRPSFHLVAILAASLGVTLLVAAAMRWGPSVQLRPHRSRLERASLSVPSVYTVLFAVAWGSFWTMATIGPKFHFHLTHAGGIYDDVRMALYLTGNLDLNKMYLESGSLSHLLHLGLDDFQSFIESRWPALIIVGTGLAFSWKKYKNATHTALFFLVLCFGFTLFSALRGRVPRYFIYEDLPLILAVSVCLGCALKHVGSTANGARPVIVGSLILIVAAVAIGVWLVQGVRGIQGIRRRGTACETLVSSTFCNGWYSVNTGLTGLIKRHYEAVVCEEAVDLRAKKGLEPEWGWWLRSERGL